MSALKNVSPDQARNAVWLQWENNKGITRAYAIDPTSEERTGQRRAFNGSLIPETAIPMVPGTEQDHFSVDLVNRIIAGDIGKSRKEPSPEQVARRAEREAKRAEQSAAKAAKNEARKLEQASKKAEKAAATKAKAEQRAADRIAKQAADEAAKVEKAATSAANPDATAKAEAATTGSKATKNLLIDNLDEESTAGYSLDHSGEKIAVIGPTGPVGSFVKEKLLPPPATAPIVKISGKAWGVYQSKKRVAFGLMATPKA